MLCTASVHEWMGDTTVCRSRDGASECSQVLICVYSASETLKIPLLVAKAFQLSKYKPPFENF